MKKNRIWLFLCCFLLALPTVVQANNVSKDFFQDTNCGGPPNTANTPLFAGTKKMNIRVNLRATGPGGGKIGNINVRTNELNDGLEIQLASCTTGVNNQKTAFDRVCQRAVEMTQASGPVFTCVGQDLDAPLNPCPSACCTAQPPGNNISVLCQHHDEDTGSLTGRQFRITREEAPGDG